ncbi:helix-turn-helix domain-containing protein [Amycolatopsis decaplanina]|uniref:helix-turn-helix domain-containing protein n=1 Tax=Amycolatopsis decaplanina TaxID=208441 RepID=UPI0009FFA860
MQAVERELIALGIKRNLSFRVIATWIGRHHSVVAREVNNNGGRDQYWPRNR